MTVRQARLVNEAAARVDRDAEASACVDAEFGAWIDLRLAEDHRRDTTTDLAWRVKC